MGHVEGNKNRRTLAYILLLLALIALCISLVVQESSEATDRESLSERWRELPIVAPQPWIELQRLTSPDGKVDAVLLERDKSAVLRLTCLRVVPRGELIKDEPPYRHLTAFLKRIIRESVFTSTNTDNVKVFWEGGSKIIVIGESADFFSQKTQEKVALGLNKLNVRVDYFIRNVTYKDKP